MKKFISGLVVIVATLGLANIAQAADATAITANEQAILDELKTGVTVSGDTFHVTTTDMTKAENHLKTVDLPASNCNQAISDIKEARQIIESTGIKATSGSDLQAQMIKDHNADYKKVESLYNDALIAVQANVSTDGNNVTIVDSNGNTIAGTGSNSGAVKKTGATYVASIATFVVLVAAAISAAVWKKKQSSKVGMMN